MTRRDQIRQLLERFRGDASEEAAWLASILTKRSMSPRHLWQDPALAKREELGRLMRERFPGLAERNDQPYEMEEVFYRSFVRWKALSFAPRRPAASAAISTIVSATRAARARWRGFPMSSPRTPDRPNFIPIWRWAARYSGRSLRDSKGNCHPVRTPTLWECGQPEPLRIDSI